MNCMVVDDEEMSSNAIKHLISQVNYLTLTHTSNCPVKALEIMREEKPDLLFLDIEMPAMSGLDLLKSLENPPLIILTTSHTHYALEAFENNALDYLVKPFGFAKFLKAVEKARTKLEDAQSQVSSFYKDNIFLKKNAVLNKVLIKDIQWVEAKGDYVTIHTAGGNYTLHMTLKALEKRLPAPAFLRIHRSYIINLEHISCIDDNIVCLGDKSVPVGSLYRETFIQKLNLIA